jgi:hypothetical protein
MENEPMHESFRAEDALDAAYSEALAAPWPTDGDHAARTVATLSSQVAIWRSRAEYWRGRCEGVAESVDYLRGLVSMLADEGPKPCPPA